MGDVCIGMLSSAAESEIPKAVPVSQKTRIKVRSHQTSSTARLAPIYPNILSPKQGIYRSSSATLDSAKETGFICSEHSRDIQPLVLHRSDCELFEALPDVSAETIDLSVPIHRRPPYGVFHRYKWHLMSELSMAWEGTLRSCIARPTVGARTLPKGLH